MNKSKLKLFLERRGVFFYYSIFFVLLSFVAFLSIRWAKYNNNPYKFSKVIEERIPENQLHTRVVNPDPDRVYFAKIKIFYVIKASTFPAIVTEEVKREVKGGESRPRE